MNSLGAAIRRYPGIKLRYSENLAEVPHPGNAKLILALGGDAHKTAQLLGLVPKNKGLGGARGQLWQTPLCPIMFSYGPGVQHVDYGWYVDLLCDVATACRYVATGSLSPQPGDYRWVKDFSELHARALELHRTTGKVVEISYDTETEGLDPFNPERSFVSLQFSVEPGKSDVMHIESLAHQKALREDLTFIDTLHDLLNNPAFSLRMANGKFDVNWTYEKFGVLCTNYRMDTTLVGSLLDENRSNALDVHVKLYVPHLGGYCVSPETRLWKEDLRWARADAVHAGDVLVGFDEHSQHPKGRRCLRKAVVESTQLLELPCVEIITTRGRKLIVSDNHAWLVNKGKGRGNIEWCRSDQLQAGYRIKAVTDPLDQINTFDGGWVSGFLDGEGHLYRPSKSPRLELGWAQKPGPVWEKAVSLLGSVTHFHTWNGKSSGVMQAKVSTWGALKIMQAFRPQRLLGAEKWVGVTLPQELEPEHILSVTPVGVRKVISIQTSTKTFVAEGLASHNSDEFDRTVDKSKMREVPKDEKFLVYAGGDTDGCLQASMAMKQEIAADPALSRFYVNLLHPAARAYENVERTGVYIDPVAFKELDAELKTHMNNLVSEGRKIIGGLLYAKHLKEDEDGNPTLNLTKPGLIIDYLFSKAGLNLDPIEWTAGGKDGTKEKQPSTAMDHLNHFKKHKEAGPFVALLGEYSAAAKTRSTYVTGFLQDVRADGRFHPSYFLHKGNKDEGEGGTVTGRLSCKGPAFQTIPKHTKWSEKLRRCYVAPPGYVIVGADYSQGELRVIACIANEPTMISAYRENMDLHALTAGRFSGYTYEEMLALEKTDKAKFKAIRQLGKAGNFGLIYGMGIDGFLVYALLNYGVDLEYDEGAAFWNGFFDTYSGLVDYHNEYKELARKQGFVRTPLGRVRHLPLINSTMKQVRSKTERQAINSPVQATLSDLSLLTSAESYKRGWHLQMPQFGMVHDQNLWYCPEDKVIEYATRQRDLMENLPLHEFGWNPQLKFTVDVDYGPNLADLTELKAA